MKMQVGSPKIAPTTIASSIWDMKDHGIVHCAVVCDETKMSRYITRALKNKKWIAQLGPFKIVTTVTRAAEKRPALG